MRPRNAATKASRETFSRGVQSAHSGRRGTIALQKEDLMKLALILMSLVGASCFGLAHAHYAGHVAADLLLGATWPPT